MPKYIMCEDGMHGIWPIIFPEHVGHHEIETAITTAYPGVKVTSAGFCTLAGNVYGESVTLKLKALSEDAFWIRKTLSVPMDDSIPKSKKE